MSLALGFTNINGSVLLGLALGVELTWRSPTFTLHYTVSLLLAVAQGEDNGAKPRNSTAAFARDMFSTTVYGTSTS